MDELRFPHRLHRVAILNRSTVAADSEVEAIAAAIQKQVKRDFAPRWGIGARFTFIPKNQMTGWEGHWNIVILDDSDMADALGYHDLTPEGLPLGKAFWKTDVESGYSPSVTIDHETLEVLSDPNINLAAESYDGRMYAYENCDPVEADELGYEIDGVLLSDFVTPQWFSSAGSLHLDHLGHVTEPFELAPGGFISVKDGGGWSQVTNFTAKPAPVASAIATGVAAPGGSRRSRRVVGRANWTRSIA